MTKRKFYYYDESLETIYYNYYGEMRYATGIEKFNSHNINEENINNFLVHTSILQKDYIFTKETGELKFNPYFNKFIGGFIFPEGIIFIIFGYLFNQRIDKIIFPKTLKSLTFGSYYDCSLDNVVFSEFLETLIFGTHFNHEIINIKLPDTLITLIFGDHFNKSMDNVNLPLKLRTIEFGYEFNQSLDNVIFPESLEIITFGHYYEQSLLNIKFPENLKKLKFKNNYSTKTMQSIPDGIEIIYLDKIVKPLDNLPITLKEIIICNDIKNKNENLIKIPWNCVITWIN